MVVRQPPASSDSSAAEAVHRQRLGHLGACLRTRTPPSLGQAGGRRLRQLNSASAAPVSSTGGRGGAGSRVAGRGFGGPGVRGAAGATAPRVRRFAGARGAGGGGQGAGGAGEGGGGSARGGGRGAADPRSAGAPENVRLPVGGGAPPRDDTLRV